MGELVRDDGFRIAFVVALACAVAVASLPRRWRLVGLGAGVAASIGALVGLFATDRNGMLSLLGVVLIAIGAALGRYFPGPWTLVAAVPGAAVLALALHAPVPDSAAIALFLVVAVVAPCAVATDRGIPRLVPLLLAGTAVGMWATTPDTEHTRVMAGALVGVVVLALDRRLRAGAAGTAAIVGLMAWAATVDGYPRDGALVGALACFGVVVLLPAVGRTRIRFAPWPVAVVLVVQASVVVVASRVAGLRAGTGSALAISAAAWAIAAVVLRFALPASPRGRR